MDKSIEREALESAIYQQLLGSDPNEIMGKNPETRMQLTGVQKLLDKFINDLHSKLHLIEELKIKEFLQEIGTLFDLDMAPIHEIINTNLDAMRVVMDSEDALKQNMLTIMYMTLTKAVEHVRETSFKTLGYDRIVTDFEEKYDTSFQQIHRDYLQTMQARGKSSVSLLYNLTFINALTDAYNKKKFDTTMKRLITQKVNEIVSKIHRNA